MKHKTQDSKFYIENNRLVGQSGPVPDDEPLFIIRARDVAALDTLRRYRELAKMSGANSEHLAAVQSRIEEFFLFSEQHKDRMKIPDTSVGDLHDRKL